MFPETSAKFDADAAGVRSADAPDLKSLLARLPGLAAEIKKDAARRDRERELPFEAFRLFRASGLSALRVPVWLGGPGGSIADYVEMIVTLAAADPNVAHALRSHFNFSESLILAPSSAKARAHLSKILDGKLFGGAAAELGTARPGDIENTRLVREGEHYRLDGKKYYATGTAYADYASFGAADESGKLVSALVPADRPGVHILDDWDGMGQRLTASGGVDLVNVEVLPHEVGERGQSVMTGLIGRHTSALRQLHLLACVNGIVRNILGDAIDYVRQHARTTRHADAAKAVDDAFVQQVTGGLAATVFAVDAIVAEAGRAMGRAADALAAEAPDAEAWVLGKRLGHGTRPTGGGQARPARRRRNVRDRRGIDHVAQVQFRPALAQHPHHPQPHIRSTTRRAWWAIIISTAPRPICGKAAFSSPSICELFVVAALRALHNKRLGALFLLSWLALSQPGAQAASLPSVRAPNAMVVTAQHLASDVGRQILQRGGNAVDAAVAIGYAEAVVNPCCGNIGGGGFMLLHLRDGGETVIDFRETAPRPRQRGDVSGCGRQAAER